MTENEIHYVTVNGNTLGYMHDDYPNRIGILRASIINKPASRFNELSGLMYLNDDDIIEVATQEDFDYFRVSSVGHITD